MTAATPVSRGRIEPRLTRAGELPLVSAFLRDAFPASANHMFASQEMLAWKYFAPAPAWVGGLSYVLDHHDAIAAHAGICPTVFSGHGLGPVRCATIIDWAADHRVPGAGIALYRRIMKFGDAAFLIGGADTTRALAPRLGFRHMVDARVYARWVRPVSEFLRRPPSARGALRLLHSAVHPPFTPLAARNGWEIAAVKSFDASIEPSLAIASRRYAAADRTVEQMNHRLACPSVETRGYVLHRLGRVAGCAIVALGSHDARILDVRVNSREPSDWTAAYAAITDALTREPRVCRITVLASVPLLHQALEANGYWINRVEPVLFHDPAQRVASLLPLSVQFFESDLAYYSA
jgi:hypothetical protein